jgi:hypothetical protein
MVVMSPAAAMTVPQFIHKWRGVSLTERAANPEAGMTQGSSETQS